MKVYLLANVLFLAAFAHAQVDYGYQDNRAWTHDECISAYSHVADSHEQAHIEEIGMSDVGRPIHLFYIGDLSPERPTLLINNAIHPGESCGVQASLKLMEELLQEKSEVFEKINIAVIPMYNVGGGLNRSCCTRANQDGPSEQGFRGNARHLDLNRDFMKTDSRNAWVFQQVFHRLKPALFVDTHTSNGADYPYTMTLIHSQPDMIDQELAQAHRKGVVSAMNVRMAEHYPMIPYMDLKGQTPREGIVSFPDWPRYSTGYAGLWNCYGFTTETHMLKPFSDRVMATYHFLDELIRYSANHADEILKLKREADKRSMFLKEIALDFELDTLVKDSVFMHGYEAVYETSAVTGLQRLRYNRDSLWSSYVPHWKTYKPRDTVSVPTYYYLPQAWGETISRLEHNGIVMERLSADTLLDVEVYYIEEFETVDAPYEGHYLHSDVSTRMETQLVQLYMGDYRIPTLQPGLRYILNVLEPRAKDSFFAWGQFDAILQQKEWFSPYVFEDMAEEILANDAGLRRRFEEKKKDPDFASNMWAQLIYIYRNSSYYEEEHRRYPIFRSKD